MADDYGPLTALLAQTVIDYGGTAADSYSVTGGMPRAGGMGATNSYQQAQQQVTEDPIPAVYLGKDRFETAPDTPRGFGSETTTATADKTEHPADLMEKFAKASPEEQRKMALLLSLGGYAGEGSFEKLIVESFDMTLGDTIDAYNKLLQEAATQYVIHGNKVTPDQLLRRGIAYKMPSGTEWDGTLEGVTSALSGLGIDVAGLESGAKKAKEPFTGTKTTTATNVSRDIMEPADAKALTRAMLQRELGRDPTEGEFEDFISAIQHAQRVNPTVSKTKNSYTYEEGEMVSQRSNTTTRGGLTEAGIQDIALQKARQNPNWAEWQAMGTYAPALFEALGATVSGR